MTAVVLIVHGSLPQVRLSGLRKLAGPNGDRSQLNFLKDDRGAISAFAVTGLNDDYYYTDALEDLIKKSPVCLETTARKTLDVELSNGSSRKTFATQDSSYPECIATPMGVLAASFDEVERHVSGVINQVLGGGESMYYPSANSEEAKELKNAPHKDHVHVYRMENNQEHISHNQRHGEDAHQHLNHHHHHHHKREAMVPYHTDNGLFLLLTPFHDHPLVLKTTSGMEISTGDLPRDSILVLFGLGMTDWYLQAGQMREFQFHAAPHSVPALTTAASTRTVYARMKVMEGPSIPRIHDQLTFNDVFKRTAPGPKDSQLCTVDLARNESFRANWVKTLDDGCAAGEAFCWMNCLPLPLDGCPVAPVCVSGNFGNECGRTSHDNSCHWQCGSSGLSRTKRSPQEESNKHRHGAGAYGPKAKHNHAEHTNHMHHDHMGQGNTHDNGQGEMNQQQREQQTQPEYFCRGKTDMLMQGFEFAGKETSLCVILFFDGWTLNSAVKFGFGCVGVFLLGVAVEGLVFLRRRISNGSGIFRKLDQGLAKDAVLLAVFALNMVGAYLAMLVAMTYSGELFLCVVAGLVLGHFVFNLRQPVGESVDPCCPSQQGGERP